MKIIIQIPREALSALLFTFVLHYLRICPLKTGKKSQDGRSKYPNRSIKQHPSTRKEMKVLLNAQLIDAVEAGRMDDVKRLIGEGACPDARKRVTLRAQVDDRRGGYSLKEDTVDGESALALGILHGKVECVRTLLDKGASVDGPIEWKLGNYWYRNWTLDEWEQQRWLLTYSFPSAACLAIGGGGKWRKWKADTGDILNGSGRIAINLPGGAATLHRPETLQSTRVEQFALRPSIDIVRLLLAYGASVTNVELDAARGSPNQAFLQILVAHLDNLTSQSVLSSSQPELQNMARSFPNGDPSAHITGALGKDISTLRNHPRNKNKDHTLHDLNNIIELDHGGLHQRDDNLQIGVSTLVEENSSLRSRNTELLVELATLRLRAASLAQPPIRSPASVHQMVTAIAEYLPQSDDELHFEVGDELFVNLAFADGWGTVRTPQRNILRVADAVRYIRG